MAVTLYRQGGKGKLIECTPESVLAAVFEGAQLGLSPDPHLGEFWLVPRSSKVGDKWVQNATFQIGVKGLAKLARRSGEVLSIKPVPVYRGDEFMLRLGSDPHRIDHVPNPEAVRTAENLVAVYAVAQLENAKGVRWTQFEHMFRSDIEVSADRSRGKKEGSPRGDSWQNHYTSMAQVRVVGKLCNWLPRTDELALALHRDAERELGIEPDAVIQVDAEPPRPGRRTIQEALAAAQPESEPEPEQATTYEREPGDDPDGTAIDDIDSVLFGGANQ